MNTAAFTFGTKVAVSLFSNTSKSAAVDNPLLPLGGAAVGAGVGALTSKKNRLRNALIGAGVGGAGGYAAEASLPGLGLGVKYKAQDLFMPQGPREKTWYGLEVPTERDASRMSEVANSGFNQSLKNILSGNPLPGLDMLYPNGPIQ